MTPNPRTIGREPTKVTKALHRALRARWGEMTDGSDYETFLEHLLAVSWHANNVALKVLGRRKITDKTKREPKLARELDAVLHLVDAVSQIEGKRA